jgi:hypothetical protein
LNRFIDKVESNNDLELKYGDSSMKILENGDVDINNGNLIVKAP